MHSFNTPWWFPSRHTLLPTLLCLSLLRITPANNHLSGKPVNSVTAPTQEQPSTNSRRNVNIHLLIVSSFLPPHHQPNHRSLSHSLRAASRTNNDKKPRRELPASSKRARQHPGHGLPGQRMHLGVACSKRRRQFGACRWRPLAGVADVPLLRSVRPPVKGLLSGEA